MLQEKYFKNSVKINNFNVIGNNYYYKQIKFHYIMKSLQNTETIPIQPLTQIMKLKNNFDERVEINRAILSKVL